MATPDRTQVPKGQEQEGQPPSTPPEDLEKRLTDLQSQLSAKDQALADTKKELKQKDSEARRLQAAADQRARLLQRVQSTNLSPNAPARVPNPQTPPQPSAQDELMDFANEQAKEAALLREVIGRRLSLEDVEGIEFESTQELKTQLDILQQKKEIAELREQLSKNKEEIASGNPPSELKIDSGGRSVPEAQQQLAGLQQTRDKAREMKSNKRYQEATWLALKAARRDPNNVSLVRPSDDVE